MSKERVLIQIETFRVTEKIARIKSTMVVSMISIVCSSLVLNASRFLPIMYYDRPSSFSSSKIFHVSRTSLCRRLKTSHVDRHVKVNAEVLIPLSSIVLLF